MHIGVLGAGLLGSCLAIELASKGIHIDVYDKNELSMSEASLHNEGKIHLGFVYANDPSLKTARLMNRGALTFAPLLRRWIGSDFDEIPVSSPFFYAVHRDSLLPPDAVERHLRACSALAHEHSERPHEKDYFGMDYRRPPDRLQDAGDLFDPDAIVAAFSTPEVGIDPEALASKVRARLEAEPRISSIMRARVLDVDLDGGSPKVRFETAAGTFTEGYDWVFNTLGNGRLAIDSKLGLTPRQPWLYRIKHFLRVRVPKPGRQLPSTTVVLGPFGDIANYGNGTMYLSWYRAGMRGMSSEISPPSDWPLVLEEQAANEVRSGTIQGLTSVLPSLSAVSAECIEAAEVKGGVIFAWGSTDIDDLQSGLHVRSNIGPKSIGRYFSIDPGKLTTAPMFAKIAADAICLD